MTRARVALLPAALPILEEAVAAGGGAVSSLDDANALVWTDPFDPEGLRDVLGRSRIEWVQLPFAGIEAFVAAGVVDGDRTWTCTKGVYGHTTAEHAVALMLAAARRIHVHARASSWEAADDPFARPERSLENARVLLVGTGGIGAALVEMLGPLRAVVTAVNRSGRPLPGARATHVTAELPALLPDADFVVLAAALTEETRGLIDARALASMRPDAWLVNVARGALVDTRALVRALRDGTIGGAALDVTEPEPLPPDHPLWELPNALVTPHVANTWPMAVPELAAMVRRNVARFTAGEALEGVVDPALGY
ncbi:MAG TPA: D-isomer specific 2-hydroxyacid dehydrogenase family protein [Actinomycetota bacterium]|nr:D-isomer specific 2-hydroxyacid dehydrogenase family protein [Actinomycetota bacterium]